MCFCKKRQRRGRVLREGEFMEAFEICQNNTIHIIKRRKIEVFKVWKNQMRLAKVFNSPSNVIANIIKLNTKLALLITQRFTFVCRSKNFAFIKCLPIRGREVYKSNVLKALLALGDSEGIVDIWNWLTGEGKKSFKAHNTDIENLLFVDEKRLITTDQFKCLKVWNWEKGMCLRILNPETWPQMPTADHRNRLGALQFKDLHILPNGNLLAFFYHDVIEWDFNKSNFVNIICTVRGLHNSLCLLPDNKIAVTHRNYLEIWNYEKESIFIRKYKIPSWHSSFGLSQGIKKIRYIGPFIFTFISTWDYSFIVALN